MLPSLARKKIQTWIRSRHLICSGNFFLLETLGYSTVEQFETCIKSLGGTLITVKSVKCLWIGNHRRIILYQAKATLHNPNQDLRNYWFKYGGLQTRFDDST